MILRFNEFNKSLKENHGYTEDELNKMDQLGVGPEKEFPDAFSVLDFFGGALPQAYNVAKREAGKAGYNLSMNLWHDALMMSMDGEDGEMYEATAAEVATKKAAIEQEEATLAKTKADLAVKRQAIKPEQPDALQAKAAIEAEEAKLAQQEADIAKRKGEISKMTVTA